MYLYSIITFAFYFRIDNMSEPATVNVVVSTDAPAQSSQQVEKPMSARAKRRVQQKANRKKGKQNKKSVKSATPFMKDIQDTFSSTFGDTNNLVFIIIAAIVIMSHKDDITGGIFGDYLTPDKTGSFGSWVRSNVNKAMGVVMFVPVIMAIKEEKRFIYGAAAVFAIVAGPVMTVVDYLLVAAVVHIAMHVKNKSNRTYLLAAVVGYMYWTKTMHGQIIVSQPSPPTRSSHNS